MSWVKINRVLSLKMKQQLSGNTIKPCENLTGRNPYEVDLAECNVDAVGMGRAQLNRLKEKHV